jgi:ABC-type sugar transport system ATPase subunit
LAEPDQSLKVRGLTVVYPGNAALQNVSLSFERGRVHVLAGENGAGKSTLIKVLTGSRIPDEGEVLLGECVLHMPSPAAAAKLGIRAVHQELQLFAPLTVWENVTAGVWAGGPLVIDAAESRRRAESALGQLGLQIGLDAIVSSLPPAEQQKVAIARALAKDAVFLIFDEPTASLSRPEREELLKLLRRLTGGGVGIVFVSHHLEEALAIGDQVSVLRDGRLVWSKPRLGLVERDLVIAMFGGLPPTLSRGAVSRAAILTEATGFHWGSGQHSLDLAIVSGEVLGIVGLPGSDAESLPRALSRLIARSSRWPVGYIPADRKAHGLFLGLPVALNVGAASLGKYSRFGVLSMKRLRKTASEFAQRLRIVPPDVTRTIDSLSGGNQQKTLLARWLAAGVKLLLADEPTRGVDIATKVQVHQLLRDLANSGGACVVYSSDLHEITALADRILVLRRDGTSTLVPSGLSAESLFAMLTEKAA